MLKRIKYIFKKISFITIKRAFFLSLANFWRNKFSTISTTIVISLILFFLNITVIINFFAEEKIKILNDKVDIIVYLKDEADLLRIKSMEEKLKKMPEIKSVTYTSKEAALAKFLKSYPQNENPFEKYTLKNPLPADITIITFNPEDYSKILSFLKNSEYNDLLKSISESDLINEQITKNLLNFTFHIKKILLTLIGLFLLGTIFIIINSINLSILNRKKELEIMTLVGARISFIRLPFIFEGIFYVLSAIGLNIIFFSLINKYFIAENLNLNFPSLWLYGFFSIEIVAGIILGILSSFLAARFSSIRKLLI